MDKIFVTIGGIGLIGFIWWFFFGKNDGAVAANGEIDVIVDGGYVPSVIKIKKGQKTKITLLRKDENSCLEDFILSDFKIKEYLPLGKKVSFEITPDKLGEYGFHCGMNMFHGKVVVE
jgi:plastocyanin domain-containing protein